MKQNNCAMYTDPAFVNLFALQHTVVNSEILIAK